MMTEVLPGNAAPEQRTCTRSATPTWIETVRAWLGQLASSMSARDRSQSEQTIYLMSEVIRQVNQPREIWSALVEATHAITGASQIVLTRISADGTDSRPERLDCWPRHIDLEEPPVGPEPLILYLEAASQIRAQLTVYGGDRLKRWPAKLVRRLQVLCSMAAAADHEMALINGTDPFLTFDRVSGLHTSAFFDGVLVHAISQAKRQNETLSVLILSVDHLTEVRKQFGDQVADAALRRIAIVVTRTLRISDIVGRIGPTRIAAILIGADSEGAQVASGSVLEAIRESSISSTSNDTQALPVGLATFPDDGKTSDELLHHAAWPITNHGTIPSKHPTVLLENPAAAGKGSL